MTTTVQVRRTFKAPRDRVFDAWLNSQAAWRWMEPATGEVVAVEVKPRLGAGFRFVVRRDGQEIEHLGQWRELMRPTRLAFSWSVPTVSRDSTVVNIELTQTADGTLLTLSHLGLAPDATERSREGWTRILEAMAPHLT